MLDMINLFKNNDKDGQKYQRVEHAPKDTEKGIFIPKFNGFKC